MSRPKSPDHRLDCGCVIYAERGNERVTLCRGHTLEWTIRHLAAEKSARRSPKLDAVPVPALVEGDAHE